MVENYYDQRLAILNWTFGPPVCVSGIQIGGPLELGLQE